MAPPYLDAMLLPLLAAVAFHGVVIAHHQNGAEEPARGAVVTIENGAYPNEPQYFARTVVADAGGSFAVADVPSGWYYATIESSFGRTSGGIFVPPRDESRRFVLQDAGCARWSGVVRNADSGAPVPHARVEVLGLGVEADDAGIWSIRWGCGNTLKLHNTFFWTVSAPRYETSSVIGGRAESVTPFFSIVRDFLLEPLRPEHEPRPRFRDYNSAP